jgi:hypothetical protein
MLAYYSLKFAYHLRGDAKRQHILVDYQAPGQLLRTP